MNGYAPVEVILGNSANVVGASATTQVVSKDFRINPEGSLHLRIDMELSAVTISTGTALILQTTSGLNAAGSAEDWVNAKSTSVITNGLVSQTYLVEVSADQTYLPLRCKGRIVCTSGSGDTVTINSIRIMQEE
jgi:hypothetical protein